MGGLNFCLYNELQGLSASWLCEGCHDVAVEPPLQPLTGESLFLHLLIIEMDIHSRGF